MNSRCLYKKDISFRYYGQRGITVCEEWKWGRGRGGFERFLAYMGPRPEGMTLDRKDSNGNYEPGNVQWAPSSLQTINKRPERRRLPLQRSLAYARAAHAFNGKIWGPGASEWLSRTIREALIEEFGPVHPVALADFCVVVEEAYWARDYGFESFHYEGLESLARDAFPHRKLAKPKPSSRKTSPRKQHSCSECGSIAHTKGTCPKRRAREAAADAKLDREIKAAERARIAEQRRIEREAASAQREFNRRRSTHAA